MPGNFYAISDSAGNYSISLPPKAGYTVSFILFKGYWAQTCPVAGSYSVNITDSNDTIYGNNNFAHNITKYCSELSVELVTPVVRRCFTSKYYVKYCNVGTKTAKLPVVSIDFDANMIPTSSTLPRSSINGRTYNFNIDSVRPGECGHFEVSVFISCFNPIGQTKCVEAIISPSISCVPIVIQYGISRV